MDFAADVGGKGECKSVMQEYMACIKAHRNDNGKCRHLSKAYLQCRMDKCVAPPPAQHLKALS
jgi:hypothetical protein